MLLEFFLWWYGSGWKRAWRECFSWVRSISDAFSIDVLLKTLFSPWKRIVTMPGGSIDDKVRAMIDNLISRVIGFFVRIIVLALALLMVVASTLTGLLLAVAWPLMPLAGIVLIVWGLLK